MTEKQTTLSRVADTLYWMSRYLERAEHISRLLDVHLNLMLDSSGESVERQRLQRLQDSLTLPLERQSLNTNELLRQLTFDMTNLVSIISTCTIARENARQVREQISSEMWMQMNKLYLHVKRADVNGTWRTSPHDFYLEVREGSHLFQGITDATMNHNQGWHFIQLGRYIERALNLLQLLDVHFQDVPLSQQDAISTSHYFELVATLKSVSAFEAYCKVYNPNVLPVRIVEFLLFNMEFPRSLRFCVEMILADLNSLSEATGRSKNSRLYRVAGRLQSSLSYDDMTDVQAGSFHNYIANIKQQILQIHDTLYDTYITYPIEAVL